MTLNDRGLTAPSLSRRHSTMHQFIAEQLRDKKFRSLADVDDYLGRNQIECLICGKLFKSLGCHLAGSHGITNRQYKIALGIPMGRFLARPVTRARQASVQAREANRAILRKYQSKAVERAKEAGPGIIVPLIKEQAKKHVQSLPSHVRSRAKREKKVADAYDALHETMMDGQ